MPKREITELLIAHREGDRDAFERLVPLVYEDLQVIARQQLAKLRFGDTLNTTALVHEAYLKLADQTRMEVQRPLSLLRRGGAGHAPDHRRLRASAERRKAWRRPGPGATRQYSNWGPGTGGDPHRESTPPSAV